MAFISFLANKLFIKSTCVVMCRVFTCDVIKLNELKIDNSMLLVSEAFRDFTMGNFSIPEILALYKEFLYEMFVIIKFSYQSL